MKILARIHTEYTADRLRRLAESEAARRRALRSLAELRPSPERTLLPRLA